MKQSHKTAILSGVSLFVLFAFSTTTFAMCTWGIVPPFRKYEPLDATEAFISYEDGVQQIVLVPEFKGDAEDFGIIYPTPSKPSLTEGPTRLFAELNELTNPETPQIMFAAMGVAEDSAVSRSADVVIIEQRQVGDYDATVLTAETSKGLTNWLEENGYEYDKNDTEKFDYYVDLGGFYFVALKINMEDAELDENDEFVGELEPLQISFKTDEPHLPMRSLKSSMPVMTFDLYVLSDDPWILSGVDTYFARRVTEFDVEEAPTLGWYDPVGKWLVRQEVKFDPSRIEEDVTLDQVPASNDLVIADDWSVKKFDTQNVKTESGILEGTRGQLFYTDGSVIAPNPQIVPVPISPFDVPLGMEVLNPFLTRNLSLGSVGEDVRQLQIFLNQNEFTVSESGPGSFGNESTYFGNKTKSAVIEFQNQFADQILVPVGLTRGTGFFGGSSRAFFE